MTPAPGIISPLAVDLLALLFPEMAALGRALWDALAREDPGFLEELRREGLTPFLYQELRHQGREGSVAPAFLQELRQDYAWSLKVAARQDREIFRVLRALTGAGVEVILLKGVDWRLRLYGDLAQRPMTDLDLLIDKGQLPQTREALARLNYRVMRQFAEPRPGHRERFENELGFAPDPDRGLLLDLHWEVRAAAGFYRLPYPPLRDQGVSGDYQGVPVKFLAPAHALIHLCLHAFGDRFETGREAYDARQILDLALALSRLAPDWTYFLAEVSRFQCQAPVYQVLRELGRLLPFLVPRAVLTFLADYRPPLTERLLLSRRLGQGTNYLAICQYHPPRDWLRYLAAKLWPDRRYLAACFGRAGRAAYLKQFLHKLHQQT